MSARISWIGLLVAILVLPTGCSEEDVAPGGPNSQQVTVTGTLTQIRDDIPVDGGAILDLELDDGSTDALYLPPFSAQPPTEEQEQAYQLIQQLKPGDRVKGRGERTDYGIRLGSLTKL